MKIPHRKGDVVLVLPDIHLQTLPTGGGSFNYDVSQALWTALEFGKDLKPNITIILGDFIDFHYISNFATPIQIESRRLKHDFIFANLILDIIDSFTRKTVVYTLGNHDQRLATYIATHPQIAGLVSLDNALKLGKRGYILVPEGEMAQIGNAHFVHGWYYNMHHAKKTAQDAGVNVFYGHTHDIQSFSKSNVNQKPIIAQSLGCLCDLNPEYKRNKPNRWVNGFGVFYFHERGDFTYYVPTIINEKFWWAGKVYGEKKEDFNIDSLKEG